MWHRGGGWATLKSVYAAQSTARQMQLKQEMNLLVKGPGETLKDITRATDLRDQLLSAGYEVREVEVVLSVLNGLPENYALIRTVLEQKQDLRLCSSRSRICACSSTVLIIA